MPAKRAPRDTSRYTYPDGYGNRMMIHGLKMLAGVLDWHCRYGGDDRLRWRCARTSACSDASSNLHAVPDADIRAGRDGIPDLHASTYAGAVAELHAVPNQHSLSDVTRLLLLPPSRLHQNLRAH